MPMKKGKWLVAVLLIVGLAGCQSPHTPGAANQQNEDSTDDTTAVTANVTQTEHQTRHHGDIDGVKLREWVLPNFENTMQATDQMVADASKHTKVPASLIDDLDDYRQNREAVIDYFSNYHGHNITVGTSAIYDCDELVTVARNVVQASRQHQSMKTTMQQYDTARQSLLTDEATINRLSNYS